MSEQRQTDDKVPLSLNGSLPVETASEVKTGEVTVQPDGENEIGKTGAGDNAAIYTGQSGNDVVQKTSELTVQEKVGLNGASEKNGDVEITKEVESEEVDQEKKDEAKDEEVAGGENDKNEDLARPEDVEAHAGDKRKADEKADANNDEEEAEKGGDDTKKQKTSNGTANGTGEKKKLGRPKGAGNEEKPKREKKVPVVGKSERKTRSQGTVDEA